MSNELAINHAKIIILDNAKNKSIIGTEDFEPLIEPGIKIKIDGITIMSIEYIYLFDSNVYPKKKWKLKAWLTAKSTNISVATLSGHK